MSIRILRFEGLRPVVFTLLLCVAGLPLPACGAERPPNVVLIMADDLGARDLGVLGSRFYETPRIDSLARRGVLFTEAYAAAPICSPTRASVLTGLYPARLGFTNAVGHEAETRLDKRLSISIMSREVKLARSVTRLDPRYVTLAEAFREAGYATGHFGKWHLGPEPYDPLHHGFEVDIPRSNAGGVNGYLAPRGVWPDGPRPRPGEHLEERTSAEVVRFMREHRDTPFFVNYWMFSVHPFYQGKPELIRKYAAKADPHGGQRNPVMGAMIETMDTCVGRVVDAIEELGLSERTIVVFLSDNGASTEPMRRAIGPLGRRLGVGVPASDNAPLRAGKGSMYEGGTRVPLIVVRPGRVKAGSRSQALVSTIDLFPTLLELTGIHPQQPIVFDGISFAPALAGRALARDALFFHQPHTFTIQGGQAILPASWVRRGSWKLIRFYRNRENQATRYELYDLANDPSEARNLAAAEPERVRELDALIDGFLQRTEALVPEPR